jgi:Predicted permease
VPADAGRLAEDARDRFEPPCGVFVLLLRVRRARPWLFRKGADFTAVMAFQFASTNLVVELGIIMALLLGWQFVLGEFVGGPLMIVLLALLFRAFLRRPLIERARAKANEGELCAMEGHAAMDMSVETDGRSVWQAASRHRRSSDGSRTNGTPH